MPLDRNLPGAPRGPWRSRLPNPRRPSDLTAALPELGYPRGAWVPLHLRETPSRQGWPDVSCAISAAAPRTPIQDVFPILSACAPCCCSSTLLPVCVWRAFFRNFSSSILFCWLSGEPSYPYTFPSLLPRRIVAQFHHGTIPSHYLKYQPWLRQ